MRITGEGTRNSGAGEGGRNDEHPPEVIDGHGGRVPCSFSRTSAAEAEMLLLKILSLGRLEDASEAGTYVHPILETGHPYGTGD